MGRLQNMLQSLQDVILVELSSSEEDEYIIDVEEEFEYKDEEGEWYAITKLIRRLDGWYMEYDESYEIRFDDVDISLQCQLIDYLTSKENSNEMD